MLSPNPFRAGGNQPKERHDLLHKVKRFTRTYGVAALAFFWGACGGSPKRNARVVANVQIGECADPKVSGVLSASPTLRAAHRDLNGDGTKEKAYADRKLCRGGNCSWNLFTETNGCSRYIGTVSGATIETSPETGDAGFAALRVWWTMGKGARHLVQTYRFRVGGYQLTDVLMCRQDGDDRLLCASEEPDEHSTVD